MSSIKAIVKKDLKDTLRSRAVYLLSLIHI